MTHSCPTCSATLPLQFGRTPYYHCRYCGWHHAAHPDGALALTRPELRERMPDALAGMECFSTGERLRVPLMGWLGVEA